MAALIAVAAGCAPDVGDAPPLFVIKGPDAVVLSHGLNDRWCLDCHSKDNRDVLRLADGREIPFEKAYRLCAQCHGEITYEWSLGVHGKRTGNWNGEKEYYLCANCHKAHDPAHDPRIKGLEPEPPPMRPEKIGR